jgi:hypothetical protein
MIKNLYYLNILFAFLIGGGLVFIGFFPDRYIYLIFLFMLFLPKFNIKFNGILIAFITLAVYLIIVSIIKKSSLPEVFSFSKFIIFPFIIFYLVKTFFENYPEHRKNIFFAFIVIALIQLPAILIQKIFYSSLINLTSIEIAEIDFTFGTFWVKNDPGLTFFLLSIIVLILFGKNNYIRERFKTILAITLTLTLLLTNSQLGNLLVLIIWFLYIIKKRSFKTLLVSFLGFVATGLVLFFTNNLAFVIWKFSDLYIRSTNITPGAMDVFFEGGYSRAVAIYFFWTQPIKILGDGLSKYTDMATGEQIIGLKGQLFTFYAEIGLLGIVISSLIIIVITKFYTKKDTRYNYILMGILLVYMFTTSPFSDVSFLTTFFSIIFINSYGVKLNGKDESKI